METEANPSLASLPPFHCMQLTSRLGCASCKMSHQPFNPEVCFNPLPGCSFIDQPQAEKWNGTASIEPSSVLLTSCRPLFYHRRNQSVSTPSTSLSETFTMTGALTTTLGESPRTWTSAPWTGVAWMPATSMKVAARRMMMAWDLMLGVCSWREEDACCRDVELGDKV